MPLYFLYKHLKEKAMANTLNISERAKRRLQLAANFLRARKYKFEGNNFYNMVIKTIYVLEEKERNQLKDLVDWIEIYEITLMNLMSNEHAHACLKPNIKNGLTKNGSSSLCFRAL